MNKIIYILLLAIVSTTFPQKNKYYNEEFNFEFQFPEDWQPATPTLSNIKALYEGPYKAALNILTIPSINAEAIKELKDIDPEYQNFSDDEIYDILVEGTDYRYLSKSKIEEYLENIVSQIETRPNIKIKEKGIRIINQINYVYFGYEVYVLNNNNDNKIFTFIQYQTNYKGNSIVLTGSYPVDKDSELRNVILSSFATMKFLSPNLNAINNVPDDTSSKDNSLLENPLVILTLIGISIVIVIAFYNTKKKKNISKTSSSFENSAEDNQDDDINEPSTNHKSFSDSDPADMDIEIYEEIDETKLNELEKARVYGNLLGLQGKITKSDITKVWKIMMDKYHPDRVSHLGKEFQVFAEKKTKDINKAYLYFKKKYNL